MELLQCEGKTAMLVARGSHIVGLVAVADTIRRESAAVVAALKERGIEVWMLTGDNARTAQAIAGQAGIENVLADVLPGEKAAKIKELQEAGGAPESAYSNSGDNNDTTTSNAAAAAAAADAPTTAPTTIVAMVGDGVNDSPALAQADVGMAIGAGTDIAIDAADVVLMRSDLRDIITAVSISRRTYHRILINFVWAFMYNTAAIPVACGIFYPLLHPTVLPPWAAGLAMALSSVSVVLSSLMLKLYTPPVVKVGGASASDLGSDRMPKKLSVPVQNMSPAISNNAFVDSIDHLSRKARSTFLETALNIRTSLV